MCVSTVILLINNIDAISSFVLRTNISLLIATDPFAKTIIFCEDIDHAEHMRKAIVNAAGQIVLDNPKYVMRITGDSVEGKAELDNFIDPESKCPVIATTSELLTTVIDNIFRIFLWQVKRKEQLSYSYASGRF